MSKKSVSKRIVHCMLVFLENEVYVLSPIAKSLALRLELYEGDAAWPWIVNEYLQGHDGKLKTIEGL